MTEHIDTMSRRLWVETRRNYRLLAMTRMWRALTIVTIVWGTIGWLLWFLH